LLYVSEFEKEVSEFKVECERLARLSGLAISALVSGSLDCRMPFIPEVRVSQRGSADMTTELKEAPQALREDWRLLGSAWASLVMVRSQVVDLVEKLRQTKRECCVRAAQQELGPSPLSPANSDEDEDGF
jgi:hypothetical protein